MPKKRRNYKRLKLPKQKNKMLIVKQKMTLANAVRREGMRKDGTKFLFYSLTLMDGEANVIKLNLSNELSEDKNLTAKLSTLKLAPCTIDITLYQSGFTLKGTVVKIEF
jgi:hypothetical protein